jgi:hypothetical protein
VGVITWPAAVEAGPTDLETAREAEGAPSREDEFELPDLEADSAEYFSWILHNKKSA